MSRASNRSALTRGDGLIRDELDAGSCRGRFSVFVRWLVSLWLGPKLAWSARESEPTGQWSDTGNTLPSRRYRAISRRAVPRLTGKVNRERTGLKPDILHCTDGQRLAQPIRISFSVH